MSDPIFGMSITRQEEEIRPAITTDMSIIGLVFTAPDADASIFPVNTAVKFYSDDAAKLLAMGAAGTGYDAVQLINEQLDDFQVSATIVGVRVTQGANTAATVANLRGDINARTGMFALLDAGAELGVVPRIIIVPGYTSQPTNGIGSVAITTAGTGYSVGAAVTATGGAGSGFAGVVSSVNGAGGVTGITITNPGVGYTSAPTLAVAAPGTGAAATATVDANANGVLASLPTLLDRLLAVAPVDGPMTSEAAARAWRATINSERIIPAEMAVKRMADDGSVYVAPGAPAIAGIGVRVDHQHEGRPFHSWANQPVYGIVGPARPIDFSILDGSNEGQSLLSVGVGVVVRGEGGDGAIADGGYIYVGTDGAGDDPLWQFYSHIRGRDYSHLMFIKTLRYFLGRRNLNRGTVEDVLNTMDAGMRDIQATGDILGFKIGFAKDQNSPEQLRLGRFKVLFKSEEPPVLRHLGISSARYRPALDSLLNDLLSNFDTTA